ncbi:MAG TPA: hypothetical protein VFT70_15830 [Nocardioides sp.]|nr:hypothetical protein [Nocardioides sp.]
MKVLHRHPLLLAIPLIAAIALIVVLVRANPRYGAPGRPEPWSSPVVSADGTRVTISYTVPGCSRSEHTETAEGRDEVTITVLVGDDADTPCGESTRQRTATITLDEPLDDRRLVDGARD